MESEGAVDVDTGEGTRKRNTGTDHRQNVTCETPSELSSSLSDKTADCACEGEADKPWKLVHYSSLPQWLADNEYLIFGHRPPLNSYSQCFNSVFRIHTETGNIWTHLIGCAVFVVIACRYAILDVAWQQKLVFLIAIAGAIMCMGLSWIYHTVNCHSKDVRCIFHKLDHIGIALLTMGSMVPYLYYCFYWRPRLMLGYIIGILTLGTLTIIASTHKTFATPKFRPVRAGTFIVLGLSAVVPVGHIILTEGLDFAINVCAIGPLFLMAALYIGGAIIYAARVPEKLWPGKFDICFQSHQIFHVCVVVAACVHYHGISTMAENRAQGL